MSNSNNGYVPGRDFVYPPARAVRVALTEFERRAQQSGVRWGVAALDEYLVPMVPGDLVSVLARPGMGKTSLLLHLSRRVSASLPDPQMVVYATWETLVEEYVGAASSALSGFTLEDLGRGRADLGPVRDAAISLLGDKVQVFGRSMESEPGAPLRLDELADCLLRLEQARTPVGLLLIDYLQRIPGPAQERSDVTSENLERIKDLALSFRTPVVVAVQARREVDDQSGIKLPTLRDGQWSSNIEQTSDKVLAVTLPSRYMPTGSVIRSGGRSYAVNDSTLVLRCLKQRWGPSGDATWVLNFNPRTYEITAAATADEEAAASRQPLAGYKQPF